MLFESITLVGTTTKRIRENSISLIPKDFSEALLFFANKDSSSNSRAIGMRKRKAIRPLAVVRYFSSNMADNRNTVYSLTSANFSLIDDDFGVPDEDCFEFSIVSKTEVAKASKECEMFCKAHGQSTRLSSLIALSIEEMTNNIIEHGFDKDRHENSIDIRLQIRDGEPILRIRDNCRHFDPVKYTELHSDEDPVSHIGIRMVMKLVKSANYVNSMGLNNLTLTF